MKITLILSAMILLCCLYGKVLVRLVSPDVRVRGIIPHIGYAYFLVFFYVFFVALRSPETALLATVVAPVVLVGGAWAWSRKRIRNARSDHSGFRLGLRDNRDFWLVLGVCLLVIAVAVWPYLRCGWGNYWQSGNYDMEDGLNGRDAYLNGLIFDKRFDLIRLMGDRSWYDFAKVTGTLPMHGPHADTYRQWYAGDGFRLQYSSLAFWSALTRQRYGLDILLEQELLNLLLMTAGVYFLARHAFLFSEGAAVWAAALSVLGSFYINTYFAGHMGSLIYGSLAPAWLYVTFTKPGLKLPAHAAVPYSALLLGAMAYSYPHPLAVLVPPVLVYRFWENGPRQVILKLRELLSKPKSRYIIALALVAIVAIGLFALWDVTAGYRARQQGQYRAWGYVHDWLVIPLYLGLMPQPLEGTVFLGGVLSPVGYTTFIVLAACVAAALGWAYWRFRPKVNGLFFQVFGLSLVAMYLVFRFAIVDSYYLYKFLYTQQFVVILGVVGAIACTRRRLLQCVAGAVVAANLASDIQVSYALYRRQYNHATVELTELVQVSADVLRKSFVELAGGEGVAAREVLKAHGLETNLDPRAADYFLVPATRESDITGAQLSDVVARIGQRLAIRRAPAVNYLWVRTWNEPEASPSDPVVGDSVFRWVGSGRNDHLGIYVVRPWLSSAVAGGYLRVCFAAGPSAIGAIPITVASATNEILASGTLDGLRCVWIPAETAIRAPQPLVIHSGAAGKSLLPHDDRILLYRVLAVGWTTEKYDHRAMSLLNKGADITIPNSSSTLSARLGGGWQALEKHGGERFRWAGRSPEIILSGGNGGGKATLEMDVERGPGYGVGPFRLSVRNAKGDLVFQSADLPARATIQLPLPQSAPSVYTLSSGGSHTPVGSDPRELDFRVFRVTCFVNGGS